MTEKRANEIFKMKYPNGEIRRPNSTSVGCKYWVIFNLDNGKVYGYNSTSYVELLQRFGFNLIYKHTQESYLRQIAELEEDLNRGYRESCFFDEPDEPFNEKEIAEMTERIECMKEILKTAIIE